MAGRSKDVLDIREMIRRLRLGEGNRALARDLGVSRNTIAKYRELAQAQGWLATEAVPDTAVIAAQLAAAEREAPGPSSTVEPYRALVEAKRQDGVPIQALLVLLQERGFTGSYGTLRRFVAKLAPTTKEAFLRVETEPGEEAQVDFGYVGLLLDPRTGRQRQAWAAWLRVQLASNEFLYVD